MLLLLIVAGGVAGWFWQQARLTAAGEALRARLDELARPAIPPAAGEAKTAESPPSSELLKLRSEVTMLNQELRRASPQSLPPKSRAESDWAEIHSGRRVSQQAGFIANSQLAHAGNATPAQAFQTLQFAMRNQENEPLTPAKMKEIWDVPDDFDDPNARYSISLGRGIGGETGYRIVREDVLSANEVRLVLEFETRDGGSFRQEQIVARRDGKWRVKPEGITRAE